MCVEIVTLQCCKLSKLKADDIRLASVVFTWFGYSSIEYIISKYKYLNSTLC